jgi:GAF domain-containing protein
MIVATRKRDPLLAMVLEVADALLSDGAEGTGSGAHLRGLQVLCRHARSLTKGDLATVAAPSDDASWLELVVADGARAAELLGTRFPRERSVSGDVIRTGQTVVLADARLDHRAYQPIVATGGIGPAILLPIGAPHHRIGTLAVCREAGRPMFTERQVAVAEAMAAQASVALTLCDARQHLHEATEVAGSRDAAVALHDVVVQRLFGIGLTLQVLASRPAEDVADRLGALAAELDATVDEIRREVLDRTA